MKPVCVDGTQAHRWKLRDQTRDGTPAYCSRCRQRWVNPPVKFDETYWRQSIVESPEARRAKARMERTTEWQN